MKRTIDNEDEIISVARRHGFEVIYPEEHSWEEQVSIFSGAKFILGEPSSGMHNTIFSNSDAHILSIGDSRMQGALAALQGQQITLLGHREAYWEGDTIHFNFSPERFDDVLNIMQGNTAPTVVGYSDGAGNISAPTSPSRAALEQAEEELAQVVRHRAVEQEAFANRRRDLEAEETEALRRYEQAIVSAQESVERERKAYTDAGGLD